ncbi:DUF6597 domain-containing transcriptional factor [Nocardia rosealba]|uniref:DUF6597 domain-containing transcriptional factor n=1 Tax=Nocardia rosealba TaxID=2878563 RepID=UPI001CDA2138|nr:DUF6597 domain-containing transcriptional factor [Nocardia rosealba]MCA2210961.1 AraC family transcriptional regulator [Nocardia rosealba]
MQRDPRELGGAWRTSQRHIFTEPPAELAGYVERFWAVAWNYDLPYRQVVVPLPNVHLTCRDGRAELHGPSSSHVYRELAGVGCVFGVAFRPGMFRPFLGASVASLRDRTIDATTVFGPSVTSLTDPAAACRFLEARLPAPDSRAELAARVVAGIAADPTVTRVDEVADRFGTTVRGLQRLGATDGLRAAVRRFRRLTIVGPGPRRAPLQWRYVDVRAASVHRRGLRRRATAGTAA